jgi:acetolactate synthase regulatory subunit
MILREDQLFLLKQMNTVSMQQSQQIQQELTIHSRAGLLLLMKQVHHMTGINL